MSDQDDQDTSGTGQADPTPPRDADELREAVTDLGGDDDERLDTVAERNASLEERLPGDDDLPLTTG